MQLLSKFLTATIFLFILSASSFWAQSWTVENITNTDENERSSVIDIGPDGNAHIVFEKITYFRKGQYEDDVYYAKQTNGNWGTPIQLGSRSILEGYAERHPSLDVDVNNVAHVVFDGNSTIYYWKSDTDPSDPVLINNFFNEDEEIVNSYMADIAVNSDASVVHIVFTASPTNMNGNLYYTNNGTTGEFDGIKNIETADGFWDEGRLGHNSSIDIDENGTIGILFSTITYGETPEDASDHISYVSNPNPPESLPRFVVTNPVGVMGLSNFKPLKLINGISHILYKDNDNLLFTKWDPLNGATLTGYPILVAQGIGWGVASFDYEINGDIEIAHIVYTGKYNAGSAKKPKWKSEIRYIQLNVTTGMFSEAEKIHDGTDPFIIVDHNGNENISFTNNSDIFYATNNGSSQEPGGVLHVSDIVMDTDIHKGSRWNAVANVTVVNAEDQTTVDGALVEGDWSGEVSSSASATISNGIAILRSPKTKKSGTITFTVASVSKNGWSYDDPSSKPFGSIGSPFNKQIAENEEYEIPDNYALFDNYPNPFNPSTKIKYQIPDQVLNNNADVTLKVFDVLGIEVATLVNQKHAPGKYEVEFNAIKLTSGMYFYRLQAGDFIVTKKMTILK